MDEMVILVDQQDRQIGLEERFKVHREGKLHRALSVFIFNERGEMLLQKRAQDKHHSGGLWSNACCSHPRPDESVEWAAARRLREEMGFHCELKEAFCFIYKAELEPGLIEHECDHVFVGHYNGKVFPDPREVEDYRWLDIEVLKEYVTTCPEDYTVWFKIALTRVLEHGGDEKGRPLSRS